MRMPKMDKIRLRDRKMKYGKNVILLSILLSLLILSSVSPLLADFITVLLGTDPSGDAHPASLDILKVYIANNGTHFKFILECRGTPAPSFFKVYIVWMDTKGGPFPDYCLVADGISGLFEIVVVDGTVIIRYKAPIVVTVEDNRIHLMAKLSDIEYPSGVKEIVSVVATTHQFTLKGKKAPTRSPFGNGTLPKGPEYIPKIPHFKIKDRAPDTGRYTVAREVIPELPGITPFIFIPSVIIAIYIIYKKKFQTDGK